jgi:autotransporter-associated beta strand protein
MAAQTFNTNDITGLLVHDLRLDRAGYILDLGDLRLATSITMASPFPGQSRLYGTPALANDVSIDIGADLELVTFADLGETGGGYGFAKLGDGKLTLSAKNSFKGLVRIVLGLVEVTSNSGLGETDAGVVTDDGGGLSLVNVTIKGESLTLAYDGPKGFATLYGTGTNEWIGPVDVARDASIAAAGQTDEIKLNGILTGNAALEMRGAGQVILAGEEANTHDGKVSVSDGALLLAKLDPNGNSI